VVSDSNEHLATPLKGIIHCDIAGNRERSRYLPAEIWKYSRGASSGLGPLPEMSVVTRVI
jgi:hypothetical protein